jgi:hypothetical protein
MKLYKCYRSIYSLKTERCEVWANSELDAAEKATKRAESDDVEIDYPSYDERHWECDEQTGEQPC